MYTSSSSIALHQFLAGILCDTSKPFEQPVMSRLLSKQPSRAWLLMAVDNDGPFPVTVTGDSTARGHDIEN